MPGLKGSAFTRLSGRYSLGEAVDYFLRHFARADNPASLDDARDAFLEARERDGVRARSLVQLRSTLGQFIGFATLRFLPVELRPEIDRVRIELEADRAATLSEIPRRVDPALRPAARKVADDVEDVPAMLRGKLPRGLRDAVAAARDGIEAARSPSEREIAAAIVASVPGAKGAPGSRNRHW